MEEEDRRNPPKILRHAERKDSLLMRLLHSRTKPTIQQGTNDGGGGSSSSESPSSPEETLKTEPTPPVNMEDSVLTRFLRSWTKPMIQHSTTSDGVGGSSSNESLPSPAETLKTEPTPSVNVKEEEYVLGSITVDELVTADSSVPDGLSEIERQFSRENLRLVPTRFPARGTTKQNICTEFAYTGRCSRRGCPFSHQLPLLPPWAEPPHQVVRPGLFHPTLGFPGPPPRYNVPSLGFPVPPPDSPVLPPDFTVPSRGFQPLPSASGRTNSYGAIGPPQRAIGNSSTANPYPYGPIGPPQRAIGNSSTANPYPYGPIGPPQRAIGNSSRPNRYPYGAIGSPQPVALGNSPTPNPYPYGAIGSPQLALGNSSTPNPYGPIARPQRAQGNSSTSIRPEATPEPEPAPAPAPTPKSYKDVVDTGTASSPTRRAATKATAARIGTASTTGASSSTPSAATKRG